MQSQGSEPWQICEQSGTLSKSLFFRPGFDASKEKPQGKVESVPVGMPRDVSIDSYEMQHFLVVMYLYDAFDFNSHFYNSLEKLLDPRKLV